MKSQGFKTAFFRYIYLEIFITQKHIFITQIERNDMNLLIIDDIIHSQNDVQLGINTIDASVQLHNALHLAASGVVSLISLEKQHALLHTMNMFVNGIYKNDLKFCTIFNIILIQKLIPGTSLDDPSKRIAR